MKISNEQVQQILAAQGGQGLKGIKRVGGAAPADAVSMSSLGQELQKATQALSGLPDLRADKVAALKMQLESGTYQVPGLDIAGSVLRRAADKLL
jgi:negative regulator of flagellin synthesis FlgM